MTGVVTLHLLLLFLLLAQADSRGVLSIKLKEFHNPLGRTFDGRCCDEGSGTKKEHSECGNNCDYVMRLVVSGLGRANDHVFMFHRPLKYNSNDVIFYHDDNSLILTVLFDQWPLDDRVKMSAFFYDYDDQDHTTTLVDWLVADLKSNVSDYTKGSAWKSNGDFHAQNIIGNRRQNKTKLVFAWAVQCSEDSDCVETPLNHSGTISVLNTVPIYEKFEQVHFGNDHKKDHRQIFKSTDITHKWQTTKDVMQTPRPKHASQFTRSKENSVLHDKATQVNTSTYSRFSESEFNNKEEAQWLSHAASRNFKDEKVFENGDAVSVKVINYQANPNEVEATRTAHIFSNFTDATSNFMFKLRTSAPAITEQSHSETDKASNTEGDETVQKELHNMLNNSGEERSLPQYTTYYVDRSIDKEKSDHPYTSNELDKLKKKFPLQKDEIESLDNNTKDKLSTGKNRSNRIITDTMLEKATGLLYSINIKDPYSQRGEDGVGKTSKYRSQETTSVRKAQTLESTNVTSSQSIISTYPWKRFPRKTTRDQIQSESTSKPYPDMGYQANNRNSFQTMFPENKSPIYKTFLPNEKYVDFTHNPISSSTTSMPSLENETRHQAQSYPNIMDGDNERKYPKPVPYSNIMQLDSLRKINAMSFTPPTNIMSPSKVNETRTSNNQNTSYFSSTEDVYEQNDSSHKVIDHFQKSSVPLNRQSQRETKNEAPVHIMDTGTITGQNTRRSNYEVSSSEDSIFRWAFSMTTKQADNRMREARVISSGMSTNADQNPLPIHHTRISEDFGYTDTMSTRTQTEQNQGDSNIVNLKSKIKTHHNKSKQNVNEHFPDEVTTQRMNLKEKYMQSATKKNKKLMSWKRYQERLNNVKLLGKSIKKLKAVKFQTPSPVHWFVTGHPAFNQNKFQFSTLVGTKPKTNQYRTGGPSVGDILTRHEITKQRNIVAKHDKKLNPGTDSEQNRLKSILFISTPAVISIINPSDNTDVIRRSEILKEMNTQKQVGKQSLLYTTKSEKEKESMWISPGGDKLLKTMQPTVTDIKTAKSQDLLISTFSTTEQNTPSHPIISTHSIFPKEKTTGPKTDNFLSANSVDGSNSNQQRSKSNQKLTDRSGGYYKTNALLPPDRKKPTDVNEIDSQMQNPVTKSIIGTDGTDSVSHVFRQSSPDVDSTANNPTPQSNHRRTKDANQIKQIAPVTRGDSRLISNEIIGKFENVKDGGKLNTNDLDERYTVLSQHMENGQIVSKSKDPDLNRLDQNMNDKQGNSIFPKTEEKSKIKTSIYSAVAGRDLRRPENDDEHYARKSISTTSTGNNKANDVDIEHVKLKTQTRPGIVSSLTIDQLVTTSLQSSPLSMETSTEHELQHGIRHNDMAYLLIKTINPVISTLSPDVVTSEQTETVPDTKAVKSATTDVYANHAIFGFHGNRQSMSKRMTTLNLPENKEFSTRSPPQTSFHPSSSGHSTLSMFKSTTKMTDRSTALSSLIAKSPTFLPQTPFHTTKEGHSTLGRSEFTTKTTERATLTKTKSPTSLPQTPFHTPKQGHSTLGRSEFTIKTTERATLKKTKSPTSLPQTPFYTPKEGHSTLGRSEFTIKTTERATLTKKKSPTSLPQTPFHTPKQGHSTLGRSEFTTKTTERATLSLTSPTPLPHTSIRQSILSHSTSVRSESTTKTTERSTLSLTTFPLLPHTSIRQSISSHSTLSRFQSTTKTTDRAALSSTSTSLPHTSIRPSISIHSTLGRSESTDTASSSVTKQHTSVPPNISDSTESEMRQQGYTRSLLPASTTTQRWPYFISSFVKTLLNSSEGNDPHSISISDKDDMTDFKPEDFREIKNPLVYLADKLKESRHEMIDESMSIGNSNTTEKWLNITLDSTLWNSSVSDDMRELAVNSSMQLYTDGIKGAVIAIAIRVNDFILTIFNNLSRFVEHVQCGTGNTTDTYPLESNGISIENGGTPHNQEVPMSTDTSTVTTIVVSSDPTSVANNINSFETTTQRAAHQIKADNPFFKSINAPASLDREHTTPFTHEPSTYTSTAYYTFYHVENTMKTLPEKGFILHTKAPPKIKIEDITIMLPDIQLKRTPKVKHKQKLLPFTVDLNTFQNYLHQIRHGPKVVIPEQGLFENNTVIKSDRKNDDKISPELLTTPKKLPQRAGIDLQTVFTNHWPAVLGVTIGTIFLLTALVTSLLCRRQRLMVQRRRWTDSPQHLSEPPDTSEYATSSAASLTSDLARSSMNFV